MNMSQKGMSKDLLNSIKKKSGLSEQSIRNLASGVTQKTLQDEAQLRKLIQSISKTANIPVSSGTVAEIVRTVKRAGGTDSIEKIIKNMIKK
jgi:hypothetical protein